MTHRGPDRARRMLVIPDAHATAAYSNERFSWLGKMIAAERPDVIVCLGDFADMPALSAYDRGKRGFEGRRYVKDVDATRDALAKLHAEFSYGPEMVLCLGNHEARIDRAASDSPELTGAISIDDLGFRECGWQLVPYQSIATVAGFSISHHFASGVAGRPIGGMTAAATMTRLLFTSAIVGHSHVTDYARRTRPDGTHVLGIVAGCYVAPEHSEGWSSASEHLWWKGCLILEDARAGDCGELRWITQDRMRSLYGDASLAGTGALAPASRGQQSSPHVPTPVDSSARSSTETGSGSPSTTTWPDQCGMCQTPNCPQCFRQPAVDTSGLDFDDDVTTVAPTAPERPADDAPNTHWARYLGRDESTVRDWRKKGIPPSEWQRKESA